MKSLKKLLKIFLYLSLLLGCLVLGIYLGLEGEFGKMPSDEEKAAYEKFAYYKDGYFQSPREILFDFNKVSGGRRSIFRFFKKSPNAPDKPLPKVILDKTSFPAQPSDYALYWLGHSAAVLELDGKRLLFDPVFDNAAPVPFMVPRYDEAPIKREDLPSVDYIIITHNHYDHLEKKTVRSVPKGRFIVPLGVGAALRGWGITPDRITELGWGEKFEEDGLTITAVESIHFSDRGFLDRNKTLWVSYVVASKRKNIFWSGDTGYGEQFDRFKEKYGPFDLAAIEIDGWNAGWPRSHMSPKESSQAAEELNASHVLPVHWGVFDLAWHPWHESIDMFMEEAKTKKLNVLTPKIGERVIPGETTTSHWWE